MNVAVPQMTSLAPSVMTLQLDHKVRYFTSKLSPLGRGHEIMAADAPNAEERSALQQRASLVSQWLQPAEAEWVVKQLTALASVRPLESGSIEERKKALKVKFAVLMKLPHFALARAFESAHRGEIGNPEFMPSPGVLHVAAVRHTQAFLKERRQLEAVLQAKVNRVPIDPARRAAAQEKARILCAEIQMNSKRAEAKRAGREISDDDKPVEAMPELRAVEAREAFLAAQMKEIAARPLVAGISSEALQAVAAKLGVAVRHSEVAECEGEKP